jgi:hypothetical protein
MKPPEDDAAGLDDCERRHGDTGRNESVLHRSGDAGEHKNGRAAGISQDRISHGCASCSFLDAFVAKIRRKTFPASETADK